MFFDFALMLSDYSFIFAFKKRCSRVLEMPFMFEMP